MVSMQYRSNFVKFRNQLEKEVIEFYCGIGLHAKSMFVCIMNAPGEIVFHRNMPNGFSTFPYGSVGTCRL